MMTVKMTISSNFIDENIPIFVYEINEQTEKRKQRKKARKRMETGV